jgi:hypothetical protein
MPILRRTGLPAAAAAIFLRRQICAASGFSTAGAQLDPPPAKGSPNRRFNRLFYIRIPFGTAQKKPANSYCANGYAISASNLSLLLSGEGRG